MRTPPPLPEPLANRPFTVDEARRRGLDWERLRRTDLTAPFRGIRVPVTDAGATRSTNASNLGDRVSAQATREPDAAAEWSALRQRAMHLAHAYQAGISEYLVFSHVTAAHAHGLHLPARLGHDPTVHVATTVSSRRPRAHGVTAHLMRARLPGVVVIDGLRVIEPVETWCQLASVLSVDELVRIGDQLVQRQHPLSTPECLRVAVHRGGGRHGIRRLRSALDDIRPGTDSPKETELRLLLVRAGLPEPTVNAPVLNRFGAHIRLGDLVYRRQQVLVEFDGDQHRTDRVQYERDIRHLEEAASDGWRVIRVTSAQLRTAPAGVVARVRAVLAAADAPR